MTSASVERRAGTEGRITAALDGLLSSPLVGFLPWILVALLNGPGRFGLATGVSCAVAAVVVLLDVARGKSVKWFALFDVLFFAALFAVHFELPARHLHWLENWFGEVANILLAVIALGSIVVRRPFTLSYAKDTTPREYWDTKPFRHVNYVITWAWTAAFFVCAAVGYYGDAVLHNSNNLWTGWILQTGVLVLAAKFTEWYPEHVQAGNGPQLASLLIPVTGWLIPVGILSLCFDAGPTWLGVGLIVAGGVLSKALATNGQGKSRA